MTRDEALKAAESCLQEVAKFKMGTYTEAKYAETMKAKALAGQAFVELARELRA